MWQARAQRLQTGLPDKLFSTRQQHVMSSLVLQLAVAVVVAIGGLVWTLASAEGGPSWGVLGSAVVLLFTRASQVGRWTFCWGSEP